MIPAKHVFFIMDACYGGLALTRSALPGATRFLHDMMCRYSRQVLTAGKADQAVADGGGPLKGHSVFTGHLIEGLRGKAAREGGAITAQGLMAFVYNSVASDRDSLQTPHSGHIDGDGDLVFAPQCHGTGAELEETVDADTLISIPFSGPIPNEEDGMNILEKAKELVAEARYRVPLHGLAADETRMVIAQLGGELFPEDIRTASEDRIVAA